jgi:hypothetical protein
MDKLLDWLKAELTMRKIPEPMIELAVNLVGSVAATIRDLAESKIEANRAATLANYAQAALSFNELEFTTDIAAECIESAREIAGTGGGSDGEEKKEDPPSAA